MPFKAGSPSYSKGLNCEKGADNLSENHVLVEKIHSNPTHKDQSIENSTNVREKIHASVNIFFILHVSCIKPNVESKKSRNIINRIRSYNNIISVLHLREVLSNS